jgi:hypothetical protein
MFSGYIPFLRHWKRIKPKIQCSPNQDFANGSDLQTCLCYRLPDLTLTSFGPHASGQIPPSLSLSLSCGARPSVSLPRSPLPPLLRPAARISLVSHRANQILMPPTTPPTRVGHQHAFSRGLHHSRAAPLRMQPRCHPLMPHWWSCLAPLPYRSNNSVPTCSHQPACAACLTPSRVALTACHLSPTVAAHRVADWSSRGIVISFLQTTAKGQ